MSKEGPLPNFDNSQGGKFHLHSDGELASELSEFQSSGVGIIKVDDRRFIIVDYCSNGLHLHPDGIRADGGNVALKPIAEVNLKK